MIEPIIPPQLIEQLRTLINGARRIVLTCHISPDGDALGSTLAFCHVLRAMGHDCRVVTPDSVAPSLAFLPGTRDIIDANRNFEFARTTFLFADLVICMDFNARSRVDRLQVILDAARAPKVLIDHHLDPEPFTQLTISHPEQSSTSVLLYRVLHALGWTDSLDPTAATLILAGMMTDTGNFSYNATDPELYVIVADLLRRGADKEMLYKRLFNTSSESSLRICGYALAERLEVFGQHHATLITLDREDLNRFHYSKGDTESLVNRPLAIPGVVYSCFLREEDGFVKVSMRSIGDFPVDQLCNRHFNGGGHRNAAGGEFKGTLDECAQLFRDLLATNSQLYADELAHAVTLNPVAD